MQNETTWYIAYPEWLLRFTRNDPDIIGFYPASGLPVKFPKGEGIFRNTYGGSAPRYLEEMWGIKVANTINASRPDTYSQILVFMLKTKFFSCIPEMPFV